VAYLLAAAAAFVNALTSVLQRIGVEDAPAATTMRWGLMAHALKRGIWLIGFALMLVVFGLQAAALSVGELSVVQPVLTTELLFLLVILVVWFRYHLGWKEWLGSATIVVGLGAFFLSADPKGGHVQPSGHSFWVASAILTAVIAGCIVAALRGPRWWRAAAFGAATAVTAAFSAAITKSITNQIKVGWGTVLTHPEVYLLAVTGLGTVFLIQNALHAGPITASRTTMVTINPLVSIVLGLSLFGDRLRAGPLWVTLEVVSLVVLVAGVVMLARSPLVAGTAEAGDLEEMLGGARQRSRRSEEVGQPVIPGAGALPGTVIATESGPVAG
jgi:drug/metabolite transporter (DMT)-like permease